MEGLFVQGLEIQLISSRVPMDLWIAFMEGIFPSGGDMTTKEKVGGRFRMGTTKDADHIPSVDYSAAEKKEIPPPMTPNQSLGFGNSDAVYKDDFRPTTPGNSPGVGHTFVGHKDDIQAKALGNDLADSHSTAGDTDDFRPTNPGHSPGIGHSFQNTNAEPNA
ncbi:hypothetical protein F0562_003628 [Nyssa sinensis]|uniref:Uncharacterized protein n=1 Tax=Nyssa sinensis TaxID=561372 RepID=A0A5J5BX94_9ASTE|nr:hypothetical protein F0562_003628 [Nyssa sinensis]